MTEHTQQPAGIRPKATIEIDGKKIVVDFGMPTRPAGGMTPGLGEALHEDGEHQAIDSVEEGSEESFPASDPPSFNP